MNKVTAPVLLRERSEGAIPVCTIEGELDVSNVDVMLDRLSRLARTAGAGMVLDLSHTTYLDSAGVRVLFELARRMRTHRQQLRVAVAPEGIVRRVLILTALADVVPLDDDVNAALAALTN